MKIVIFGLGYVGVTTAACLAKVGHEIIGVELVEAKVIAVNEGRSPIVEAGVEELLSSAVNAGRLRASSSVAEGLAGADMAIICVGTPSRPDGGLDTQFLANVMGEIAAHLADRPDLPRPLLVVRSTVFPGTVRGKLLPILQEKCGAHVPSIVFHPEFLREGSSVEDFFGPPKIVVGADAPEFAAPVLSLYEGIDAPRHVVSLETAEMVKYADNAFHALKVTFANEIAQLAQAYKVDGRAVMEVFCADKKLNLSTRYLRPGFAFGGSCLPKDLRALVHAARMRSVSLPMLEHVLASNRQQIERAVEIVLAIRPRSVGFAGLAFKPGTDDLRESPLVELAERLLGKGLKLAICDPQIQTNRLVGKNKAYIDQVFPHLAKLLVSDFADLMQNDAVILGHRQPRAQVEAILNTSRTVIDLTGDNLFPNTKNYHPII